MAHEMNRNTGNQDGKGAVEIRNSSGDFQQILIPLPSFDAWSFVSEVFLIHDLRMCYIREN